MTSDTVRLNYIRRTAVSGPVSEPAVNILTEPDGYCNIIQIISKLKTVRSKGNSAKIILLKDSAKKSTAFMSDILAAGANSVLGIIF